MADMFNKVMDFTKRGDFKELADLYTSINEEFNQKLDLLFVTFINLYNLHDTDKKTLNKYKNKLKRLIKDNDEISNQ